ncbi:hypothetical protein [Streptomyces sp. Root369]|uniref:hypothetical protein n=1 Tax=Streptomyces sp. Root369 TaxID=1736523 RepID=UPI00070DE202|nr:hypothetical protein [Streptomyces sp. Root369]KQW13542.1 hypothetical protein ASD08_30720 [Streptomyces sp. Root369]
MTTQPQDQNQDFTITADEVKALVPWLHQVLPGQPKEDENSDLCQLFSRLLIHSNRHFGTSRENRETCICRGWPPTPAGPLRPSRLRPPLPDRRRPPG